MKSEWKRLFSLDFWAVSLVICIVIIVSAFRSANEDYLSKKCRQAYQEVVSQLVGYSPQEQKELLPEMIEEYEGSQLDEQTRWLMLDACNTVNGQLLYAESYADYVDRIRDNAARVMKGGPFGSPDSYAAVNAKKTVGDFEALAEVRPLLIDRYPFEYLFQQDDCGILSFLLIVYLLIKISRQYRKGLWEMIYAAEGGRVKLVRTRILCFFAASCMSGVFYMVHVISALTAFNGWADMNVPVQSLSIYQTSPLKLSVMQMIFVNGAAHILGTFALAVVFLALFTVIHRDKLSLALTAALCLIEEVVYLSISANSSLRLLRILNIAAIWNIQTVFQGYQNYPFAGHAVGQNVVVSVFLSAAAVISVPIAVVSYSRRHPKNTSSAPEAVIDWIRRRMVPMIGRTPKAVKEAYKIIILQHGWFFIIIWLWLASDTFSGVVSLYADTRGLIEESIYQAIEGKSIEDAKLWVSDRISVNQEGIDKTEDAWIRYQNGSGSYAEYCMMYEEYKFNQDRKEKLEKVQQELERQAALKTSDRIKAVNPLAWRYLTAPLDLTQKYDWGIYHKRLLWIFYQLAIIVFLIGNVFPFEYQSRMTSLLKTMPLGRKKLERRKCLTVMGIITVFYAAGCVMEAAEIARSGGSFSSWSQPAAMLEWFSGVPEWISLWMILAGIYLFRLLLLFISVRILLLINCRMKRMTSFILLVSVVVLLPMALQYLFTNEPVLLMILEGIQMIYRNAAR